jgi:solute carrier family 25 carnitine/acylcarnitine transporter 20/29
MGFTLKEVAVELLHGSLSGLSLVLICHPADTLKTRRQLETFRYPDMIKRMIKKEGIFSFYKGVLSPMISMPMFKSVIFCSYKLSLLHFERNKWFDYNRDLQVGVAGLISGFLNSFVCGPKDLFKVKLQLQKDKKTKKYNGYYDIYMKTFKISGFRNIFQGTLITILRESLGYPVAFVLYEKVLRYYGNGNKDNTTFIHHFIGGAVSGVISWVFIFPFDVVKSRIQALELTTKVKIFNNYQILSIFKSIYRKEGIRGLYNGMGIYMIRGFFGSGIAYAVWNWLQLNMNFGVIDTSKK